jgi:phage/plasmid primase-like uncharacterized protein
MVATVQDCDGKFLGIHRTWLRSDGSGKADVEPQKMALGPIGGGAVRLTSQPPETLAIAEGIETALSVLQVFPTLAVWAAVGTSGMRALKLLDVTRKVIICADNDANRAGQSAAHDAGQRFLLERREVIIVQPGVPNSDFNDRLRI